MQTIIPAANIIRQGIGRQKAADVLPLRKLTYVLEETVKGGKILYNLLTCEMLMIVDEELESEKTTAYLKEHWFLVPQNFDDVKFCLDVKRLAYALGSMNGGKAITNYTIFTTMDCNARCYYCYELGRPRRPMTKNVAEDVARYIIEHADGKEVSITWFGGEPLYNIVVIDTITKILRENGQKFKSGMISNGYLLTTDVIRKAKEDWNLKKVQITLDGTHDEYNRSKAFIYKGVDAYSRVLDNIGNLLEAGIRVDVRLNVSSRNGDDLIRLVDELHERFGKQQILWMYAHLLYECTDHNVKYDEVQRHKVMADYKAIMKRIEECGYKEPPFIKSEFRYNCCMADNDHALTITPDGRLGKCEHYSENNFVGSIYDSSLDMSMINAFRQRDELTELCHDCAFLPSCSRLKLCENLQPCTLESRQMYISNERKAMLNTYNAWKEWRHSSNKE